MEQRDKRTFDEMMEATTSFAEALALAERFEKLDEKNLVPDRVGPFRIERRRWLAALSEWGGKDLAATSEYLLTQTGTNSNAMRWAVDGLAEQYRSEPQLGMEWAMKVKHPELRKVAIQENCGRWFTSDEKSFSQWLATLQPGRGRDEIILEMIQMCTHDDQKAFAEKWIEKMQSESLRKEAEEVLNKNRPVLILQ